jgi:hypothetical protein
MIFTLSSMPPFYVTLISQLKGTKPKKNSQANEQFAFPCLYKKMGLVYKQSCKNRTVVFSKNDQRIKLVHLLTLLNDIMGKIPICILV